MTRLLSVCFFLVGFFVGHPVGAEESQVALEKQIFELVNKERTTAGLAELKWDDRLAEPARYHSERMAKLEFFSHVGPDREDLKDRFARFGLRVRTAGENIFKTRGYDKPSTVVVKSWMESKGHKENILDPAFTEAAIGISKVGDIMFFTQVFAAGQSIEKQ